MSFNPDPNKQPQKVLFSGEIKEINHLPITFSKITVSQTTSQKHFGVILDSIWSFDEYLISIQSKIKKTIGLPGKLQNSLSFNEHLISVQSKTNKTISLPHKLQNSVSLDESLITVQSKTNKTVGLFRKLQNILLREVMITIYKQFVRPHLDYCDILYDEACNVSFYQKLEKKL